MSDGEREGRERASERRKDWSSKFSWVHGMPIMGSGGSGRGSDAVGRSLARRLPLKSRAERGGRTEWEENESSRIVGISS